MWIALGVRHDEPGVIDGTVRAGQALTLVPNRHGFGGIRVQGVENGEAVAKLLAMFQDGTLESVHSVVGRISGCAHDVRRAHQIDTLQGGQRLQPRFQGFFRADRFVEPHHVTHQAAIFEEAPHGIGEVASVGWYPIPLLKMRPQSEQLGLIDSIFPWLAIPVGIAQEGGNTR